MKIHLRTMEFCLLNVFTPATDCGGEFQERDSIRGEGRSF